MILASTDRTAAELARAFGVSGHTIYCVLHRKTWRHISLEPVVDALPSPTSPGVEVESAAVVGALRAITKGIPTATTVRIWTENGAVNCCAGDVSRVAVMTVPLHSMKGDIDAMLSTTEVEEIKRAAIGRTTADRDNATRPSSSRALMGHTPQP